MSRMSFILDICHLSITPDRLIYPESNFDTSRDESRQMLLCGSSMDPDGAAEPEQHHGLRLIQIQVCINAEPAGAAQKTKVTMASKPVQDSQVVAGSTAGSVLDLREQIYKQKHIMFYFS